jgi:hypothetical protein
MKGLFRRDVYIRLADDGMNFVCTTQYGRFYTKTRQIPLHVEPKPEPADEMSLLQARKRFSYFASAEEED